MRKLEYNSGPYEFETEYSEMKKKKKEYKKVNLKVR